MKNPVETGRDSPWIHNHRHAQLAVCRGCAVKPYRLGIIDGDGEEGIIVPTKTRPDITSCGAGEGLAGGFERRAGDGVGGVDFELDLVADVGGEGVGGEG
jgi:hypothetical protein